MIDRSAFATFASATAFALVLSQALTIAPVRAETQGTDSSAQTPQLITQAEDTRLQMDERRAAADEQRRQRYEDLRTRAAEVGIELPETPPWESIEAQLPERMGSSAEDLAAQRERRQAAREARWQQMQQEATERGIPLSDASPWEEAAQRRQEMAKRYQEYRETIEAMTEEQREAARAIFGRHSGRTTAPYAAMPQRHHATPYWNAPCHGDGTGYPSTPNYYYNPSYDQGPPPPPVRSGQ